MSHPQDLLYTNSFSTRNVLTESNLKKDIEYYDRFVNYNDQNITSDYVKYIEDNEYEESQINLNKTLDKKWPVGNKKNHYPLFDTYTNDISTNRYKKEMITKVSIDTRNRDISKYENPNSFSITLPKKFNNVKKLVINDLIFKNINQSVTNINNNLSWQYPSENFLNATNINNTIIPVPGNKRILYSELPNSVYKYTTTDGTGYIPKIDNYLVYQADVTPAFYDVDKFIDNIRYTTSNVVHGQNYIETGIEVIEQPYLAQIRRINSPHLFTCDINTVTSVVKFVNRMEELQVIALQTFSPYETDFTNVDIFYYFSSQYSNNISYALDTNLIYVIVEAREDTSYQYYNNLNYLYSANPFPLVLTGLNEDIGGINAEALCYTPFFDINIYLNNGYTQDELNQTISYYKFIDTITYNIDTIINGNPITINNTYLRFGLSFSSGTLHGNSYNKNGVRYTPVSTNNYLYNTGLFEYYSKNVFYTNYEFYDYNFFIGRALLFRWIYDIYDNSYIHYEFETINEKKRSVLHMLAWPIANKTYKIFTVESNAGYNFIQSNAHVNITYQEGITTYNPKANEIPLYLLNLQSYNNKYYFVNNSYIYIRLSFNTNTTLNTDQYIVSVSDELLLYNQQYVNSNLFNVGIGEDYTNIVECQGLIVLVKNSSNIFAKLMLSNNPGDYDITASNIINNNGYTINYESMMDDVNEITVELLDPQFRVLELDNYFSFTLNIHQVVDVLKETLINTKTNNVNSTGNFI